MARSDTDRHLGHWLVSMVVVLTLVAILSLSEGAVNLTDSQKMTILNAHNYFRKLDVRLHNASNVRRMQWNDDLADLATEWVDHCKRAHSPWQMRFNRGGLIDAEAGENIWIGGYSTTRNLTNLVAAWYNEKRFYDYENGCKRGAKCGHYTQVVRSDTYKVGCAITSNRQCGNYVIFSCNYAPMGLLDGYPYYLGIPCDECFGNFTNYCIDGLCSETDDIEWTPTTTIAPLTIPNNEEPRGVAYLPWDGSDSEDHLEAEGNDTTTPVTPADTTFHATSYTATALVADTTVDATTSATTEFLADPLFDPIAATTNEP